MLIYEATKREFMEDAINDNILNKICSAYRLNHLNPGSNEFGAWKNSVQDYMYKVLSSENIPDDSGIAIEFKIPLTSNRIDFMISGYDEKGQGNIVIIELKQWEGKTTETIEDKDGLVKTFLAGGIRETLHPSYQVWSYYKFIKDFNEDVQKGKVNLFPCAYLHNFQQEYRYKIDNKTYAPYVRTAPLYLRGDALKLREFIEKFVKKGDNKQNLYYIDKGKIKPAKSLQDSVSNMLDGNEEFILIDSQKIVFENALSLALKSSKDNKKRVMIVEGGPGTGKSVLAINLLVKLINKDLATQYISKNAAPRNVYMSKLKGNTKTQKINHLFSGSGAFTNYKSNFLPALIVDEAHRLNEKSGLFKNTGENQIKEIIKTAKFSIFFIDEDQKVDIFDIGSKEEIEKHAKKLNANIFYYQLDSQFRCNGSEGYLSWLDDLLGIKETANEEGFNLNYEIKIFDNPNELQKVIEEKNKINNKARIVAGYCWNWLKEGKNDSLIPDITIGDNFKISWNLGNTSTWAIDPESVKEVGCIHTSQGLEFDYIGVIIGEDLRYEDGQILTDFTKRARTDRSLMGIKTLFKKSPEEAKRISDKIIKNTYRTLMTRGQKGCYVYCCDKNLANYLKQRLGY